VTHVENTVPSFRAALDEGANAVELDLSLTKDGRLVLWHDWNPNAYKSLLRALCIEPGVGYRPVMPIGPHRKRVSSLLLREFLEHYGYAIKSFCARRLDIRVPTLRDFFEWGVGEPRLLGAFFDLKVPRDEIGVLPSILSEVDALVSHHAPCFKVVLETAEVDVLAELHRLRSRHAVCFDVEPGPGFVRDLEACSAVRTAVLHGAQLACPQRPRPVTMRPFATHARIVAEDVALQRIHNADSPRVPLEGVVSFTINDEEEMSSLISLGVAGIQSDKPGLLYRVAARMGKVGGWRPAPGVPTSPPARDHERAVRGGG
jgi:glycerophosphoryl diester phosphodiesterase